jgi:nucleotide-binding universal stress UspA family protein
MFPVRTILHPTDFSEPSRVAFHLAARLAHGENTRLIVLHATQTAEPLEAHGDVLRQLRPPGHVEELWRVLRRIRPPDPAVRVEHRLAKGEAVTEILRVAAETGCDLIVMGSHGLAGPEHPVSGSVTEQVLCRALCPVVMVQMPPRNVGAGDSPAAAGPAGAGPGRFRR